MAGFPALPLFVREYRMDTLHLTAEQHGAYLLLLMQAWISPQCRLPDCDHKLAAWAGVDPDRWSDVRQAVEPFFVVRGGWWTQKRLSQEWRYVQEKVRARREAGRKGGVASSGGGKNHGDTNKPLAHKRKQASLATALLEQNTTIAQAPTPTPTLTLKDSPKAPSGGGGEDAFDRVERRCLEVLGERAPADAVIGPIIDLVRKDGLDLEGTILPLLKQIADGSRMTIRTWKLYAELIRKREIATRGSRPRPVDPNSPPPAASQTRKFWAVAIDEARNRNRWNRGTLGPAPNEPGCLAPADLLTAEDRAREWRDAA